MEDRECGVISTGLHIRDMKNSVIILWLKYFGTYSTESGPITIDISNSAEPQAQPPLPKAMKSQPRDTSYLFLSLHPSPSLSLHNVSRRLTRLPSSIPQNQSDEAFLDIRRPYLLPPLSNLIIRLCLHERRNLIHGISRESRQPRNSLMPRQFHSPHPYRPRGIKNTTFVYRNLPSVDSTPSVHSTDEPSHMSATVRRWETTVKQGYR